MKEGNVQLVLKSARALIAERGDAVSVREIAAVSGLSHPAVRKKWRNREALMEAVRVSINEDVLAALGTEPKNETLSVFLVKALFALQQVQDAPDYYSFATQGNGLCVSCNNPLLDRLIRVCTRHIEAKGGQGTNPLHTEPTAMAAAIFSLLLAFSPSRVKRVCEAAGTPPGVQEQLPILALTEALSFLNGPK